LRLSTSNKVYDDEDDDDDDDDELLDVSRMLNLSLPSPDILQTYL